MSDCIMIKKECVDCGLIVQVLSLRAEVVGLKGKLKLESIEHEQSEDQLRSLVDLHDTVCTKAITERDAAVKDAQSWQSAYLQEAGTHVETRHAHDMAVAERDAAVAKLEAVREWAESHLYAGDCEDVRDIIDGKTGGE